MAEPLFSFIAERRRLVIITGAGISTPSGIGDYRDRNGEWKRAAPIQHDAFVRSHATRQRYWARSFHGWRSFIRATPNPAHRALANPQLQSRTVGVITQNVDRLHQTAGQSAVIDLHGRLDRVVCLGCRAITARSALQDRLAASNPWLGDAQFTAAPDGDADLLLTPQAIEGVQVPVCEICGGILKPDVVFYGDSVPRVVVDTAYGWVDESDGILIIGTSLMVFSSFRFCRHAYARGIPLAVLNQGLTRADDLVTLRLDARCEEVLPALVQTLAASTD
ncbi:MAG: NAD-dependent protein deacetylase [Gammaproteobacteria bacterium]|nr:NAD-dependent protein deacetylase [Gammaproteobacteria bacterium]